MPEEGAPDAGPAPPVGLPTLPAVPGPRARRWLTFEFVTLAEYWIAPTVLGVTNYAGTWAEVGTLLFLGFVASLVGLVLLPLRPHLARALSTRRERALFHAFWVGALGVGLLITNTFQLSAPIAGASGVEIGSTTVYSPFGAWPSLTVYLPSIGLFGTLNVEIIGVLGLMGVLGSSVLRLRAHAAAAVCAVPRRDESSWARRAVTLAVYSPLGLVTGCTACAPLYLSALGVVAPTAAAGGFASLPIVPWIGLAGLLYLASFGLAIHLIRTATEPDQSSSVADGGPDSLG